MLKRIKEEFGEEQTQQLLQLFCSEIGNDLAKLKQSCQSQNSQRLMHCCRGVRAVCQSVFVADMVQTCLEIEEAGGRLDWNVVDKLVENLQEQFDHFCQQYQIAKD